MLVTAKTIDIEINKKQVYKYLGYDLGSEPSSRIESLLDQHIELSDQFISPYTTYTILDVDFVLGTRTFLEGSVCFDSGVVGRLLRKCQKVALFVVTIEDELESIAGDLAEDGLLVQSTVMDSIGSNAVEQVANFLQERIRDTAEAQGLVISKRRFSPGYCDWDISQQAELFEVFDGNTAGVELSETCLMHPRKSISGIIGIGLPGQGIENYNPCPVCDTSECQSRR
ncbi:MAG: hypothetical protein HN929_02165 [Chloroflexi bacterium]|jgi:hypothetical protein|nr:hypothetical protein [Chloroflexota bacterium]MBT7080266.1 hypothetical protein [Chloroflexota bacterium]MBT7289623.1 hypothetical protein [Chloroflexota bacterium]